MWYEWMRVREDERAFDTWAMHWPEERMKTENIERKSVKTFPAPNEVSNSFVGNSAGYACGCSKQTKNRKLRHFKVWNMLHHMLLTFYERTFRSYARDSSVMEESEISVESIDSRHVPCEGLCVHMKAEKDIAPWIM